MSRIALRNREGEIVAFATVDPGWAWLAAHEWRLMPNGYAARSVSTSRGNRKAYLHREIMGLDRRHRRTQVDHINRNKLDCRSSNLRLGTAATNQQNRYANRGRVLPRGVVLDKRRGCFYARCTINGHTYNLGTFSTAKAAGKAARDFRAARMPWSPDAMAAA